MGTILSIVLIILRATNKITMPWIMAFIPMILEFMYLIIATIGVFTFYAFL